MNSSKRVTGTERITVSDSTLLLVDVQERLAPAIDDVEALLVNCGKLLEGARRLEVPVVATEHCPDAIGPTVPSLREKLQPQEIYRKSHFGACDEVPFRERAAQQDRHQWVLCGVEAHVCLLQAALGLRTMEKDVFIVADAVGSREERNKRIALERLSAAGCILVTTEMVLFEWLHHAGNPAFKDILRLIK